MVDDQLPPELNDMAATLAKTKALKPDILVVSGHSKGAALAIRQVEEMRVDVPMLAITHCDNADVIGKFGAASEYTLCASQWAPTLSYRDDTFGSAADFAATFEAEYGYAPPYQAAESAAAVLVFADAFERAGGFDKDAVRDTLAATETQTFYGNIKFDETGKNIAKPTLINGVIERLQRANREFGVTLFVIEHNMRVIMSLAEHIHCLDHGRLLASGPPDALRNDQRVIDAYLGAR